MNTDGSVDSTVEINDSTANGPDLADNDKFGWSVANIGDLNNDGVEDLAVGAPDDDSSSPAPGALHILFLNTDASIDRKSAVQGKSVYLGGRGIVKKKT